MKYDIERLVCRSPFLCFMTWRRVHFSSSMTSATKNHESPVETIKPSEFYHQVICFGCKRFSLIHWLLSFSSSSSSFLRSKKHFWFKSSQEIMKDVSLFFVCNELRHEIKSRWLLLWQRSKMRRKERSVKENLKRLILCLLFLSS